jgi:hypothetical protein
MRTEWGFEKVRFGALHTHAEEQYNVEGWSLEIVM